MTLHHHPSDEIMLDYAAGNLGEAAGLAVASHISLCQRCRKASRILDGIGGRFLAQEQGVPADGAEFDGVLSRAMRLPPVGLPPAWPGSVLPRPLREHLGFDREGVPWRRLGMGAFQHVIPTRDRRTTARLLRIPAGRPVPVHTHGGVELTLVLSGAFSDDTGFYARGDLQEADATIEHQPKAAPGQDCICLAVTDAPLRFKSWAARLVQPFLNI